MSVEVKENKPETKQLLIYASNHTHMNHKSIMITCSNLKLSSRAFKHVGKKKNHMEMETIHCATVIGNLILISKVSFFSS